jgi:hypothetical protein
LGPDLVHGLAPREQQRALNIVLVSDGFTTANMDQLRDVVQASRPR